jgi:dipeptidyl-peptidase-4
MQHSMDLLQKSIELGKQIDFFVYPGHEHNIRGRHRAHLIDKISTYFKDHLK